MRSARAALMPSTRAISSIPAGLQPAQAAEMPQQAGAPARTDAGDVLQPAGVARLLAAPAVAGDGEPVRLVADLLDQLQRRGFRAGMQSRPSGSSSSSSPGRGAPGPWPRPPAPRRRRPGRPAPRAPAPPGPRRRRSAARRASRRPPRPRGGSGVRSPGASPRSRRRARCRRCCSGGTGRAPGLRHRTPRTRPPSPRPWCG